MKFFYLLNVNSCRSVIFCYANIILAPKRLNNQKKNRHKYRVKWKKGYNFHSYITDIIPRTLKSTNNLRERKIAKLLHEHSRRLLLHFITNTVENLISHALFAIYKPCGEITQLSHRQWGLLAVQLIA